MLYFGCKTLQERSEWMQAFQDGQLQYSCAFVNLSRDLLYKKYFFVENLTYNYIAAVNNDNVMLTNYHEDVYSHTKQEWTCCRSPVKSTGCVKSRDLGK